MLLLVGLRKDNRQGVCFGSSQSPLSPFVAPILKNNANIPNTMSLFPKVDVITKEIQSWKGFADNLNSKEYKELFNNMLNDCNNYATAINAKGKEPFPTEPLIMALTIISA
jgi:hypothetical protein